MSAPQPSATAFQSSDWQAYRVSFGLLLFQIFCTGLSDQKEAYEEIETGTAGGASCLQALAGTPAPAIAGAFPHEVQIIRQGLVLHAASQKLLEELGRLNGKYEVEGTLL